MTEKNCKDCIHFNACSKWTDFPQQCGIPVCAWRVIDYEEQDDEYTHWIPLPNL